MLLVLNLAELHRLPTCSVDGSYLLEDGEDELAYKEMEDGIDVEDDVFQEES